MAAAVVVSAATTAIITQGVTMLAERYLRRRYQEGLEEGKEEGREEGRKELAERLKNLSDKERQEEIDRLISDTKDTNHARHT